MVSSIFSFLLCIEKIFPVIQQWFYSRQELNVKIYIVNNQNGYRLDNYSQNIHLREQLKERY